MKERYVQQRLIPMAMEPRACAAVPQPFGGDMTLYTATQIPHILKIMVALTLGIPEQQMRVVAPAVGGGFGSKLNVYAEELLCVALAQAAQRPGALERGAQRERRGHHRRAAGQIQDIELAADENGKLIAVRVRLIGDMGAYLQLVTPGVPLLGAFLYAGVYDLPLAYDFSCTSVFTTMTPTDAYRGAGRPEATYAIERAMDALAAKIGVDPLELRKRNFIRKDQFPYTAFSGLIYDSGDHLAAAEKAAELADYAGLRARQATQNVPGRDEAPRHRRLELLRDVRSRAVPGAGLAQLRRRRLGSGDRPRPAHQQGAGGHRGVAARAGPRDLVVDDRGRQARRRSRRRRRPALRHRDQPARARHVRVDGRSSSVASPSTWRATR